MKSAAIGWTIKMADSVVLVPVDRSKLAAWLAVNSEAIQI